MQMDESMRAVYFLSGRDQDWLAMVTQRPDGCVDIDYRFRYYDPDDPDNDAHSGKDRKNWYRCEGKPERPTLDEALQKMQWIMDSLLGVGYVPKGGIACKLIRGSMTLDQFSTEFFKLPFVHAKTVKEGEPGYEEARAAWQSGP